MYCLYLFILFISFYNLMRIIITYQLAEILLLFLAEDRGQTRTSTSDLCGIHLISEIY